jgi:hypothetical protein
MSNVITHVTKKCATCEAEFRIEIWRSKVKTCSPSCSALLKKRNRRLYNSRRAKLQIVTRGPSKVTLAQMPDPNRYFERDTENRRKERAKRPGLKKDIVERLLYDGKTYLSEAERKKIRDRMERLVGRPRVWHKLRRGAGANGN